MAKAGGKITDQFILIVKSHIGSETSIIHIGRVGAVKPVKGHLKSDYRFIWSKNINFP